MAHRYYSWTHRNVTHFISPNLATPLAHSSSESGAYTRLAAPNTWHCLCLPTLWKWKQPRSWESGDLELSPGSATQLRSQFRQVSPKSLPDFSENKGIGLDHCFSSLSNTWIPPLKKKKKNLYYENFQTYPDVAISVKLQVPFIWLQPFPFFCTCNLWFHLFFFFLVEQDIISLHL